MNKNLKLIWVLMCSLIAPLAQAGIAISESIIEFGANSAQRKDVFIYNQGSETEYVEITALKIINPGRKNEKRITLDSPEDMGLIAIPNRMILAAGQKSILRISTFGHQDNETIYRLVIKPVDSGSDEESKDRFDIRILIGYEILVINRAKNEQYDYESNRVGDQLIIKNTGSSSILFKDGRVCILLECRDLPAKRIYSGMTWAFDVKSNEKATFHLEQNNEEKIFSF